VKSQVGNTLTAEEKRRKIQKMKKALKLIRKQNFPTDICHLIRRLRKTGGVGGEAEGGNKLAVMNKGNKKSRRTESIET